MDTLKPGEEIAGRAIDQFMEIYIVPEIERRQELGELDRPLGLHAAQVVFYPYNKPPEIRLNSEVKARATVKYVGGAQPVTGAPVFEHEIESIENAALTADDDPDCGHVLLILLNGVWNLFFDLRYNRDMASKNIRVAQEFLEAAEFSRDQGNWSAFIDNLFSAAELAAKATLLPHFYRLRTSKRHTTVRTYYNLFAHMGNVESEHSDLFNWLSRERTSARYAEREFSLSAAETDVQISTVRDMIETAKRRIRSAL